MRVIGFDPGINHTGFGILDYDKRNAKAHGYGVIRPPQKKLLPERLEYLHDETMKLLEEFKPDVVAVEDTFYLIILNRRSCLDRLEEWSFWLQRETISLVLNLHREK